MTSAAGGSHGGQRPRRPAQPTGRGSGPKRPAKPSRRDGQAPQSSAGPQRAAGQQPGRPAMQRQSDRSHGAERASGRGALEPSPPDDADVSVLSAEVRAELRGLSPENAERVGRHLVAAGRLLEEDPARALEHARAARRTAARLPAVREAVGLAAYLSGEWQEALTELRAVRRMTADSTHLPLLADCERGLGRPDRALALARSPEASGLDAAEAVELRIVEAGARRDLGQVDAALVVLEDAGVRTRDPDLTEDGTIRLWYAYADTLQAAGRLADARDWFEKVLAADDDEETNAADRVAGLVE